MNATDSIASHDGWRLGISDLTTFARGARRTLLVLGVCFQAAGTSGCGSPQTDPGRSGAVCGAAPEDPHGHSISDRPRDGSCHACPSPPEMLRPCDSPGERDPASLAASERLTESDVILQGTLGFSPQPDCGEADDPGCACSRQCTAPLRLEKTQGGVGAAHVLLLHGGSWPWQKETLEDLPKRASNVVSCRGNELSLCCPFELDPQRHTAEVEIHGSLQLVDDVEHGQQYGIVVDDICRR